MCLALDDASMEADPIYQVIRDTSNDEPFALSLPVDVQAIATLSFLAGSFASELYPLTSADVYILEYYRYAVRV